MELKELRDLINRADTAYYTTGATQLISDEEYDRLKSQLRQDAPDDELLTRVGANPIGTKVAHTIPMGSLDNTDDGILGFDPWLDGMREKLGMVVSPPIMASLKVDGASICASYKKGQLVRVATRGNGTEGEDITANACRFKQLPNRLTMDVDCEVRGEAVLPAADYQQIRSRDLGLPFSDIAESERSNPRNIGNGILGRHDGQDADKIQFFAFNIHSDAPIDSEVDKFEYLTKLGLTVVPNRLCVAPNQFHAYYNDIVAQRPHLPFEIDGLVVVLDTVASQEAFVTSDPKSRLRPKYARAVKFPHKSNTTIIEGVNVTVGHTRMIIPTAILREVRIGGVNVTSALLNNYTEIERLGLAIGDEVSVVLSGDIIPKLTEVVKRGENRVPIVEPKTCPSCSSPTTRSLRGKDGACTYCTNPACEAAAYAKVDCWIGSSKKGTGILDIGDSIIKALWDQKLLRDPADLYTLTADAIKNISMGKGIRIGQSRADKIIANIDTKRKLPLEVFLGSLGIELLGRRRVILLRDNANGQLDRLEDWLDTAKLATINIPAFGEAIRTAVIQGIEDNRELINKLLANGVSVVADCAGAISGASDTSTPAEKPFAGLSFCWTGTRELIDEVAKLGGEVKNGISKGLTFLVQKDATSQSKKTQKAEEYGTRVISIDYLRKAVAGQVQLSK